MEFGDRVQYTYQRLHRLSFSAYTKTGTFYGLVQHTSRYGGPQLVFVKFDGNKTESKVPLTKVSLL